MNAIRGFWSQRSWLPAAAVAAILLWAACGGCNKPVSTPPANITPTPPSYLTEFRDQFHKLEIKNQQLANLVDTLRKKLEEEAKKASDGIPSEATQMAYAEAQVNCAKSLDQLMARFEKFEADMKAAGKSTELSPETIKMITDIVIKEKNSPTDSGSGASGDTPTPTGGSGTAGDAAPGGDMGEAFKTLLKAAGVALCAVQPEICPLLGPIFEVLGLFGSTEERQTFLEAVGNQATGNPLTDSQTAVVKKAVDQGYGNMHEGLKKLINDMAKNNPSLQPIVQAAVDKVLNELGISQAQFDKLRTALTSSASIEEKLKAVQETYVLFPNPSVKQKIVQMATDLGGLELGIQVEAKVGVR